MDTNTKCLPASEICGYDPYGVPMPKCVLEAYRALRNIAREKQREDAEQQNKFHIHRGSPCMRIRPADPHGLIFNENMYAMRYAVYDEEVIYNIADALGLVDKKINEYLVVFSKEFISLPEVRPHFEVVEQNCTCIFDQRSAPFSEIKKGQRTFLHYNGEIPESILKAKYFKEQTRDTKVGEFRKYMKTLAGDAYHIGTREAMEGSFSSGAFPQEFIMRMALAAQFYEFASDYSYLDAPDDADVDEDFKELIGEYIAIAEMYVYCMEHTQTNVGVPKRNQSLEETFNSLARITEEIGMTSMYDTYCSGVSLEDLLA